MFRFFRRKLLATIFVCSLAFISALLPYVYYGDSIPAISLKNDGTAYYKGSDNIALTFNIGWGDVNADKILDILEEKKFKNATFFLSGAWMERHQHVVERITGLGYEIGILGYEYVDYTDMSEKEVSQDISKALEICKKLDVDSVKLMRTPTGEFDATTTKTSEKYGLTLVQWSIDTHDWENPGADKIYESVSNSSKGDIILMHASDSALQTVDVLPEICDFIESSNLKTVTVSEMISGGNSSTEEISYVN